MTNKTHKPHLILLHGALGSSEQLQGLKQSAGDDFIVHTMNFSGHGGRKLPEEGFSLELFESDIYNFMQSENIPSAHFFGYSMGGYVALSFASKFPEKVKSVFTLATKFDWTPETAAKESGFLVPAVMKQKIPQFTERLEHLHRPENWENVVTETARFMLSLGNHPLKEADFNKITCSVICTVGDKDKMVSREETEKVSALITQAQMMIFKDTPHPLEAVDYNILYSEIRNFSKSGVL